MRHRNREYHQSIDLQKYGHIYHPYSIIKLKTPQGSMECHKNINFKNILNRSISSIFHDSILTLDRNRRYHQSIDLQKFGEYIINIPRFKF